MHPPDPGRDPPGPPACGWADAKGGKGRARHRLLARQHVPPAPRPSRRGGCPDACWARSRTRSCTGVGGVGPLGPALGRQRVCSAQQPSAWPRPHLRHMAADGLCVRAGTLPSRRNIRRCVRCRRAWFRTRRDQSGDGSRAAPTELSCGPTTASSMDCGRKVREWS